MTLICTDCDDEFGTEDDLRSHISITHLSGFVPYECAECSQLGFCTKTSTRNQMRKHFQKKHPIKRIRVIDESWDDERAEMLENKIRLALEIGGNVEFDNVNAETPSSSHTFSPAIVKTEFPSPNENPDESTSFFSNEGETSGFASAELEEQFLIDAWDRIKNFRKSDSSPWYFSVTDLNVRLQSEDKAKKVQAQMEKHGKDVYNAMRLFGKVFATVQLTNPTYSVEGDRGLEILNAQNVRLRSMGSWGDMNAVHEQLDDSLVKDLILQASLFNNVPDDVAFVKIAQKILKFSISAVHVRKCRRSKRKIDGSEVPL